MPDSDLGAPSGESPASDLVDVYCNACGLRVTEPAPDDNLAAKCPKCGSPRRMMAPHPPDYATLADATDLTDPIFRTALDLARPEVRGLRIRLLGVTASGLGEREQLALFGADDPRRRRVVEAADAVRHRYGDRAITRARLVGSRLPAPFERDPMTPVDPRSIDLGEDAPSEPAPDDEMIDPPSEIEPIE